MFTWYLCICSTFCDLQNQQKWADAMKEDATVFQYDEVYDKMEEDKGAEAKKKEAQKKDDKNPK